VKYYIGSIKEQNGDMEYHDTFILGAPDDMEREVACKQVSQEWRGGESDDWDEDFGGFWSDNSLISPMQVVKEIDEAECKIVSKYLTIVYVE